jgi:mannan endo-1,4-beta-mannosidase
MCVCQTENVPASWLADIASFVRALAPKKLFVDGTYGVNATHLGVEHVNIYSDHFYPISLATLKSDLALGKEGPRKLKCCSSRPR